MDEVLLKVYVKEKHNLPEIINFFVISTSLKLILSEAIFGGQPIAVLMVLDRSLYKVLTWSSIMLIIL